MTNIETISWPKDFPDLKRLDNLLRCGICYDYMKSPMMTSCSHNYCSLCIRKYMQYKSVCPICFEETFEVNLRNNRPLDEIIAVFTGIRDKIIRHLKLAAIYLPKTGDQENITSSSASPLITLSLSKKCDDSLTKNVKHDLENSIGKGKSVVRRLDKDAVSDECENGVTVLSSPVNSKIGEEPCRSSPVTPVTKIPSMFCSPKKSTPSISPATSASFPTVSCPVCSVNIPERNINIHLDSCLARVKSPSKSRPKITKRDPIPKRVYSMMVEKDLRKWLKNYGLSTIGDKKTLISRLQRYTVLFNSECDSDNPRPICEIIRQVEKEEKDEKAASNGLGVVVKKSINRNADQNVIDVENKKYVEKNKSHFESLINAMRERDQKCIKPTRSINRIDSDSDEDSYCYRDTARLDNEPSTSKDRQLNGTSPQHNHFLTKGYKDDSNEVIDICDESPDLSHDSCYLAVKSNNNEKKSTQSKLDDFKLSSFVEADVYISKDGLSSPMKSNIHMKGSVSQLSPTESNVIMCNEVKNEHAEEDESEDSNESISLLSDYKGSVEDNKKSPNESIIDQLQNKSGDHQILNNYFLEKSQNNSVSQSQLDDPDFTITESELTSTNMSESEDIFIPTRRSKRQRSDKVEFELPKRVTRRKKT